MAEGTTPLFEKGRKRLTAGLLAALLLAALLASVLWAGAEEPAPRLGVDYYNLSYSDSTYLLYAVSWEGIDPAESPVRLLFWDRVPSAGYLAGSEKSAAAPEGTVTIGGKDYLLFYSDGVAPKNLTDPVYCCAWASTPEGPVYSIPVKYSPLKYLNDLEKRAAGADLDLAAALRRYGAAAQTRFGYAPDTLATDTYYDLTLENARLADGFSYGLCKAGEPVTLYADMPEGNALAEWYEGDTLLGTGPEITLRPERDTSVSARITGLGDPASWEGRRFTASDRLMIPCFFTQSPLTVEASLTLPASLSDRGGVLWGCYGDGDQAVNLEIYTGGRLRLYMKNGDKSVHNLLFDTDLRGKGIRHIALTVPAKGGSCCLYLDGDLAEQKTMPCALPEMGDRMLLGGDYREGNPQYFKGVLYSLTVYRGVRSAGDIAADRQKGPDPADPALICGYVFPRSSQRTDIGRGRRDLTDRRQGLSFESVSDRLSLTEPFPSVPLTYEAVFDTAADVSNNKGCTLVGNYNDTYQPGITFRVYLDGRPSLCLRYDGEHQDQFFIEEKILGRGRVHVAFTIDDAYVYGYLNGVLRLKKAHCGYLPELTPYPFSVGGDNRTDNTWWFRQGQIYSLRLYSAYKTQEEILRDMNGPAPGDPTLMLSFDFERSRQDLSGSGNRLVPYFYDGAFADPEEYDYTFACVGDTQSLVKLNPDKLHCIYDFLLDNADAMKIERVIGLGDMTEDNTADQWELVSKQVFRLDGRIPYTVVRGNHDHFARTPEAEATKELMFGYYFNNDTYRRQYDGSYDGTPHHVYTRFTAGGTDYLLLCLDYGPDDGVLDWASEVVERYPQDRVILATHAFLFHDFTTIDENDICPPRKAVGFNNCDEMWDKFVSKHPNIALVLCGHDPSNELVVSRMTGEQGNAVTCCLIDPQHTDYYDRAAGLVALLHFSHGGSRIRIDYYSTVEGKFYKTDNEILIDGVGGRAD